LIVEAVDQTSLYAASQKSFAFAIQSELQLSQVVNFPNPMQSETHFTFNLGNDKSCDVVIRIYTVAGRLLKTLHASVPVGYNEIFWDGVDASGDVLANGVYFYKISADDGKEKDEVVERLVVMN